MVARHDPTDLAPEIDEVRRRAREGTDHPLSFGSGLLVLPLRRRIGVFGALVVGDADHLDEAGVALTRLVADRMGVVLRDDRAHTAQLRDRRSLALLAEASELFAGTLDVSLVMTLTAQLVVPRFANWSGVYTIDAQGARLAAVAHALETGTAPLRGSLASDAACALVQRLVRELGEQPSLVPEHELPASLRGFAGELLAVPLVARGRLLAVMLVGRPTGAGPARDDGGLLLDLARRAALAVDNARLYEERTAIAQALQRSLLPPALPTGAHIEFGSRYAAAGEGNEVGGDFYDVFAVPGGLWAVAIGDVNVSDRHLHSRR
jgi:phosphoserine phosphatase RsbU/P